MLRHTLQHYPSYREALDFFTTARIVAPCYLIIAGLNRDEGALVTRDRDGEVQRKELSSRYLALPPYGLGYAFFPPLALTRRTAGSLGKVVIRWCRRTSTIGSTLWTLRGLARTAFS